MTEIRTDDIGFGNLKLLQDPSEFCYGVDAVILADIVLLSHAAEYHPTLRRNLSVQAAAANPDAINLYASAFGVRRVVLPRVLTVEEIAAINREIDVETEVFVFGGLCVMAEGRCSLSSFATGQSPNMNDVCSPASHVAYAEEGHELAARLAAAGDAALDPCWRMPLDDDYAEGLKSNFADVANVAGRAGGSITAAKFLQRFVGDIPWAHLDIAGTAWKGGTAKGATGRPVGLLLHYLLGMAGAPTPRRKTAAARRARAD